MANKNGKETEKIVQPKLKMSVVPSVFLPIGTAALIGALFFCFSAIFFTGTLQWILSGTLFTIGFSLVLSACLLHSARKKRILAEICVLREAIKKWGNETYSALYKSTPPDTRRVILNHRNFFVWIKSGSMFLLPHFDLAEAERYFDFNKPCNSVLSLNAIYFITEIPLNKIEFYRQTSEKMIENRVSGSGGLGLQIGLGALGVVVGGNSAQSQVIVHDDKKTVLSYFNNNARTVINFHHDDFHVFEELMPEKNYDIVLEIKKNKVINNEIPMQIKELAKLRDEGILTDEEFTEKKKELLQKMS